MNKSELIDAVSVTTSLARREAEEAVNAVVHAVANEVRAGRRVVVTGFGSFNPTYRGAHTGRNPQTGAPVSVPAARGVRFAASGMLKDIVNGKAKLPVLKSSKAARTSGRLVAKRSAKHVAKRVPTRKSARHPAKKIVGRAPAHKAVKRAPARKAAQQSARKAAGRGPARKAAKRSAKKAVRRA